MTHIGNYLRDYFERSGMGQVQFALQAKLNESHISKLLNGTRKLIRENTLESLIDALPEGERVAFLHAYWLDNMPESCHPFIKREIRNNRVAKPAKGGKETAFQELEDSIKKAFLPPNRPRIMAVLKNIIEGAAQDSEFLRSIEFFAKTNARD